MVISKHSGTLSSFHKSIAHQEKVKAGAESFNEAKALSKTSARRAAERGLVLQHLKPRTMERMVFEVSFQMHRVGSAASKHPITPPKKNW